MQFWPVGGSNLSPHNNNYYSLNVNYFSDCSEIALLSTLLSTLLVEIVLVKILHIQIAQESM